MYNLIPWNPDEDGWDHPATGIDEPEPEEEEEEEGEDNDQTEEE